MVEKFDDDRMTDDSPTTITITTASIMMTAQNKAETAYNIQNKREKTISIGFYIDEFLCFSIYYILSLSSSALRLSNFTFFFAFDSFNHFIHSLYI